MKRKLLSILLVLSMMIGILSIMPIQIGAAGVYYIGDESTWNDFATMSETERADYDTYELTQDIDLTGYTVSQVKNFTGTFDGKGYTISGITMETSGESGMFACSGGEKNIKNFVLSNSSFSGAKWVGAIFCDTNADTVISNVYVEKDVKVHADNGYAGGFVGGLGTVGHDVTITNCVFAGTVTSESQYNGGFIGSGNSQTGKLRSVEISNCIMMGSVSTTKTSSPRTSGFMGYNYVSKTDITDDSLTNVIKNCIYAGSGTNNYSRFADADNLTIENCYSTDSTGPMYCDDYNGGDGNDNVTVISLDDLIGLNAIDVTGFTKRNSDIMIPTGLVDIAPPLYAASYEVTWANHDGAVLATEEYVAGSTPEYKGEKPTKAEDTLFTYEFEGWSPAISEVMSNVTYTANFKKALKDNIPAGYYDVWDGTADDSFTELGSGTEDDPYIIATASQWANLAEAANDGINDGLYFELATNLDFNDIEGLKPISTDGKRLLIYFDGKGHTIKGVNMTWTSKDGTGLFGDIWGSLKAGEESCSNIKNLVIKESVFNGKSYTGAVVGEVAGNILIQNIYVDSTVTVNSTNGNAGGIVGGCYYASKDFDENGVAEITVTIEDCVFAGKLVAGSGNNGGILGNGNSVKNEIFHIVINNCLVTGYVQHTTGTSSGFVGVNSYTQNITEGEGDAATVVATYSASVTINNCVYAGGAEEVYFYNRPFTGKASVCTVTNSYTTHTAANGVYLNKQWTSSGSGVTLVEVKKLLGNNAVTIDGWTKRAGDMIIPDGVAAFAPLTYTQKMMDGASVRLNNPTGLRFTAVLSVDYLNLIKSANEGKTVRYGILITPTDYIATAGDIFTVDALDSLSYTTKYILGYADKLMSGGDADGYYEFSAVLSNVQDYNYERPFSAIAFIAVDNGDGTVTYYYSEYNEDVNSRTIAEVAQAAYNDTSKTQNEQYQYEISANAGVYSPYTETQRNLLPAFYGKVASNVNLMSYNIRNVEGGDSMLNDPLTFEYDGRDQIVVDYILSANPDVVGIQEASAKKHAYNSSTLSWFDTLAQLEAKGYACFKGSNILPSSDDKEMYNPIYYKADKYNLVGSGFAYLSEDGTQQAYDGEYRGVTYVVLEDKTTGLQFVYVNVHMTRYNSTDNYQDDVAGYLKAFLEGLTYTCPIIIGGDFNGSYSDYKGYDTFWGETALSARDESTNKTSGCSATNDTFDGLGTASGPIDLYFAMNTDTVDFHNYAVTDNKVEATGLYPSDHLPVKLVITLYGTKN